MLFQDEERRRVAEALHDSIGSKLMLVKLTFRQVLMTVKDDFAEQKYQEINSLVTDTVTEIRDNGIGIQDVDWNQPAETMGLRSFQKRAAHF